MPTVLVAAPPGQASQLALTRIVEALVQRGHRVVFVGDTDAQRPAEEAGARFVPVRLPARVPDRAAWALSGVQQVSEGVRTRIIEPLEGQWQAVQQVLAEERVDVVFTDPQCFGAFMLSMQPRDQRPPVVALGLFPLPFADPDVAPFGTGLSPLESPLNRVRNTLLTGLVGLLLRRADRELRREAKRVTGQAMTCGLQSAPGTVDLWAHLTVPRFEYPRSGLPANLRFLGPLPPADLGELPSWWLDDDPRPIVTVCHRPGDNPHDLVLPTVRALADEPVRVVVTAGRDIDLVRSVIGMSPPANLHLHREVPYAHLFPRSKAIVCTGGWLVTQWALRWGVPLVVSGRSDDRVETNARVPWLGVGVNLRGARLTGAQVREAVRRVMEDAGVRAATARIAAQIAATDALGELCAIVDELADSSGVTPGAIGA